MQRIRTHLHITLVVKYLAIVQALSILCPSTGHTEVAEVDGPYTIISPFLLRPGDPQAWWKSTFYNPAGIRVTEGGEDKLLLFVQALDNFGVEDTNAYERCVGDSVVLFEKDWDFKHLRDPFTVLDRVSPCSCLTLDGCPDDSWAYGLGSVIKSQHDGKYYLFLDKVKRPTNLLAGDFVEVVSLSSMDGTTWNENTVETLLRQSFLGAGIEQREFSLYDVTLVSEVDRWWGVFRWSSRKYLLPEGAQQVESGSGLLRVFPDGSGRTVEFLSGGNWTTLNVDGTFPTSPDAVGAAGNGIVSVDGGYELWDGKRVSDQAAEESCDDGEPTGSALGYYRMTSEGPAGDFQILESTVRPNPAKSQTAHSLPFVITDEGDRLIFESTSDTVCPIENWPPPLQTDPSKTNVFVGLEIALTYLSDSFFKDRFRYTADRRSGSLLSNSNVELGLGVWSANTSLALLNEAVVNMGSSTNPVATLSLSNVQPSEVFFSVEVDEVVEDSDWIGVGFSNSPAVGFSVSGQIWANVRPDGDWTVRMADPISPVLAQGNILGFDPGQSHHIELSFDKDRNEASLSIDAVEVLSSGVLTVVPELDYVGFQFKQSSTMSFPGQSSVDNFIVRLGRDPLVFSDGFESGDTAAWTVTSP